MRFGDKILKYQEQIFQDMARLIAIPSVRGEAEDGKPFGKYPAEALDCILKMAEKLGLPTKNVGNYAGHAEYGSGEEVAAVLTHVDVVPAGDGWETDPFTMVKQGNALYGRGVADDKGAAVVSLYCLKVLQEENVQAKRRIRTIFGAGEETGSEDLERYFEKEPMPVMGFTPDSEYGVCNREKGILRMNFSAPNDSTVLREFTAGTVVNAVPAGAFADLACTKEEVEKLRQAMAAVEGRFTIEETEEGAHLSSAGTASHAMQPEEGFNAASHLIVLLFEVFSEDQMGTLMCFLRRHIGTELDGASLGLKQQDDESGPLTLNLGLVHVGASLCTASIDIRYPVTADGEKIIAAIQSKAREEDVFSEEGGHMKPLFLPANSPFITLLQNAYEEFMGEPANLYATGGGTYARELKGRGVAFGPFFQDEPDRRLHNTGEHIDIDQFMLHAQICLEAMYHMAVD
ncbi:Sapep family Mn(2+)-dependent dipeptidase [Anaeromassilibacillus senegalensis]|uniref:Sapep family Mn(2+)-dependent dipeptidase n=1 Tax=Anaeromassilibacillus senegalensis TaxID=1673717 RepID=UPI00068100B6|nr:Sapep family Mn(2+)-dependent dipeptidase [Anaeromassilibacillus senegalensis]